MKINADQLRAMLGRKVGPLPLGAWLAIAAVGVMAAAAIARRRRGAIAPEPDAPADAGAVQPAATPGGFTVPGGPAGTGSTPGGSNPLDSTPREARTNTEWEFDANRYLIAGGYQPTIVAGALALYLRGESLDAQQLALVDRAIRGIGPPPEPVPPPQVNATPVAPSLPGGIFPAPPPTVFVPPAVAVALGTAPAPAPAPAPAAPTPAPAPAPAADITRTVTSGSTLYAMYRGVYGVYPSVAQIRAIAGYNGLAVGAAPNYYITPWRPGQIVKFPPTQP